MFKIMGMFKGKVDVAGDVGGDVAGDAAEDVVEETKGGARKRRKGHHGYFDTSEVGFYDIL